MTNAEIVAVLAQAGFQGGQITNALVTILAEGGHAGARGENADGSVDRGWFQFNSRWHPEVSDTCADDLLCSAQAAYRVSNAGTDWHQWTTWTTGAVNAFWNVANAAVKAAGQLGGNPPPAITLPGLPTITLPSLPNPGDTIASVTSKLTSLSDLIQFFGVPSTWSHLAMLGAGVLVSLLGIVLFGLSLVSPDQAKHLAEATALA